MSISALIRAMSAAGASAEAIAIAVEAIEQAHEIIDQQKASARDRKRRQRDRSRDSHGTVTGQDWDSHAQTLSPFPETKVSPAPLSKTQTLTPNQLPPIVPLRPNHSEARQASDAEFSEWWLAYPRKVAKGAAERAFAKARKLASMADLVEGARRYAETSDGQFVKHPATWLNAKCWLDEDAPRIEASARGPPSSLPDRIAADQAEARRIAFKMLETSNGKSG